jgi:hypothetical protein
MTGRIADHSLNAKPRPSAMTETIYVDDETVVIDQINCTAYVLDPVASFVWDGLVHGLSMSAIVEELAESFDAPASVISADVSNLVQELTRVDVLISDDWEPSSSSDIDGCVSDVQPTFDAGGPPDFDDRYLVAPPNP